MEVEMPTHQSIELIINQPEQPSQLQPTTTKGQPNKEEEKTRTPAETMVRVKSEARKIAIGLIITLSAVMFGYSIKEITSVPTTELIQLYNIDLSSDNTLAILNAVLPLAAIIGAVITKVLIKKFRRLTGIYVFTIVNCLAVVLINVNTFLTLILGRFVEGTCIGFYTAIAPIYLKEIAPRQLRKKIGLFFSLGKVTGVLLAIAIEVISRELQITYGYRIVLSMTGVLSLLQAVLIFFFGSDTPTEMIEKGKHHKAKQIIQKLYKQDYVEEVLKEYKQDHEATLHQFHESQASISAKNQDANPNHHQDSRPRRQKHKKGGKSKKGHVQPSIRKNTITVGESSLVPSIHIDPVNSEQSEVEPQLTFKQKKDKAYCSGQEKIAHLLGDNWGLGNLASILINVVQLIAILIGLLYVQSVMGKKPLFLLSLPLISLLNFAIAVAMAFSNVLALILLMCIFIGVDGVGFVSPAWAYPSEIIPANEALPSNIIHWITLAIVLLIPPLVQGFNNGNPFPVFIFLGMYCFIGFLHVRATIRESNGLKYKEIIKSFK